MNADLALLAVLSLTTAECVLLLWFVVCINRTYRQRVAPINAIYAHPDWVALSLAFDCVSYDTHLWRLATFRNPAAAYPAALQELIA